jgi:hypothetical protein
MSYNHLRPEESTPVTQDNNETPVKQQENDSAIKQTDTRGGDCSLNF